MTSSTPEAGGASTSTSASSSTSSTGSTEYDPGAHTVAEVNKYLEGADATERERVVQVEAAGRKRVGITNQGQPTTTVKLRHHWTDSQGKAHVPGAEVAVSKDVADQLLAANYATDPNADSGEDSEADGS